MLTLLRLNVRMSPNQTGARRVLVMISNAFFDKIKHRSYRAGYIEEHAKTHVAYQVRALREEREWTQKAHFRGCEWACHA